MDREIPISDDISTISLGNLDGISDKDRRDSVRMVYKIVHEVLEEFKDRPKVSNAVISGIIGYVLILQLKDRNVKNAFQLMDTVKIQMQLFIMGNIEPIKKLLIKEENFDLVMRLMADMLESTRK